MGIGAEGKTQGANADLVIAAPIEPTLGFREQPLPTLDSVAVARQRLSNPFKQPGKRTDSMAKPARVGTYVNSRLIKNHTKINVGCNSKSGGRNGVDIFRRLPQNPFRFIGAEACVERPNGRIGRFRDALSEKIDWNGGTPVEG
jgi:hypothetical protein